ncbi:MAG: septal ring lytic transglycosylase RlpA family protein, partial [Hydrogenobacter sp.]
VMRVVEIEFPDYKKVLPNRVINTENQREVVVKVIDRGPFKEGRVLDLSYGAARELGMIKKGEVKVIAYVLRCGE